MQKINETIVHMIMEQRIVTPEIHETNEMNPTTIPA